MAPQEIEQQPVGLRTTPEIFQKPRTVGETIGAALGLSNKTRERAQAAAAALEKEAAALEALAENADRLHGLIKSTQARLAEGEGRVSALAEQLNGDASAAVASQIESMLTGHETIGVGLRAADVSALASLDSLIRHRDAILDAARRRWISAVHAEIQSLEAELATTEKQLTAASKSR
jgi:hypothetical protein